MTEPERSNSLGSNSRARDHMANTRTLLAWIRTGVALIGLGFVVARFGLFLRALDSQAGRAAASPELSGVIGVALIFVGVFALGLGLRRFWLTGRSIEIGRFEVDTSVEWVIAVATTIAGLALAAYLVLVR